MATDLLRQDMRDATVACNVVRKELGTTGCTNAKNKTQAVRRRHEAPAASGHQQRKNGVQRKSCVKTRENRLQVGGHRAQARTTGKSECEG